MALTLGEFYEQFSDWVLAQDEAGQSWRELKLEVSLANSSVGRSASSPIVGFYKGIDWDSRTFFIRTEQPLYRVQNISKEKMIETMQRISAMHVRNPDHTKERSVWESGYKTGFKIGVETRVESEPTPV